MSAPAAPPVEAAAAETGMDRFFLVGTPRSGTTLAQTWIMSTGRVASFPETHFFAHLAWAGPGAFRRVRNLAAWAQFHGFARRNRLPRRPRPFLDARHGVAEFVACLDAAARREGRDAWLEKTPRHLYHVPRIRATVPGARFFMTTRGSAATIRSLSRARDHWTEGHGDHTAHESVARWIGDRALIELHCREPDACAIGYESLVARDADQTRAVAAFLGVAVEAFSDIDALADIARRVVRADETWKDANLGARPPSRDVDPHQEALIRAALRPLCTEARTLDTDAR